MGESERTALASPAALGARCSQRALLAKGVARKRRCSQRALLAEHAARGARRCAAQNAHGARCYARGAYLIRRAVTVPESARSSLLSELSLAACEARCRRGALLAGHAARGARCSRNSGLWLARPPLAEHAARGARALIAKPAARGAPRLRNMLLAGTVAVVQDAPVACCARDEVLAERALATPAVRGARFWRRPLFAEHFASGPRCSRRTLPAEDAARRTPLAEHAAREARCRRSTLYAVHAALGTLRTRSTTYSEN